MQLMYTSVERNRMRHSHRSSKKSRKKQQLQQQKQQKQQQLLQKTCHGECSRTGTEPTAHKQQIRTRSAGDENRITELLINLPQCKHPHHQPISGDALLTSTKQTAGRGQHFEPTLQHYSASSQVFKVCVW